MPLRKSQLISEIFAGNYQFFRFDGSHAKEFNASFVQGEVKRVKIVLRQSVTFKINSGRFFSGDSVFSVNPPRDANQNKAAYFSWLSDWNFPVPSTTNLLWLERFWEILIILLSKTIFFKFSFTKNLCKYKCFLFSRIWSVPCFSLSSSTSILHIHAN